MPGSIGRHITGNLRLWTGLGLAVALVSILARSRYGTGHHLGDLASLAIMFAGMTMILISQRGLQHPDEEVGEA